MMHHEEIKWLARQMGCSVCELVALDESNDPYYCGLPAQVKKAEWFAELWQRFGYTTGVHIRRMHYQIISQSPPVLLVSGKPYENTLNCWAELNWAAKAARYLDMVNPDAFVDRKNGEPVNALDYTAHEGSIWVSSEGQDELDVSLPDFPDLPSYSVLLNSPQRYHIELWCEKSTQDDILRPLAQRYRACLQYGSGELSMTIALDTLKRARVNKPVRILYISDFDPDGWEMPKSMAVKLQYYNEKRGYNFDIKLLPVVLTPEQCKQYQLPRTPLKDSNKSKDAFEERFGVGATELDALEAVRPGELRRILVKELDRYYDHRLSQRVFERKSEIRSTAQEIEQRVYDVYEGTIEGLQSEWQKIQEEFEDRVSAHMEKRAEAWNLIVSDLEAEQPEITDDDAPLAQEAEEPDDALFDSMRSYLEQNEFYQERKIENPAKKLARQAERMKAYRAEQKEAVASYRYNNRKGGHHDRS